MKKHIIWSNRDIKLEDWEDCLKDWEPEITDEDEQWMLVNQWNNEYLEDERANLNIDLHAAIAGCELLFLVAIPVIVTVGALGLLISQMVIHLCFHHFLDGSAEKILQGFLDVSSSLNIVFLQQSLNNVPFSFGHGSGSENFLLFVRHKNRPPMIFYLIIEDRSSSAIYRKLFTSS